MTNRSKQRGTAYETAVVSYLNESGFNVERRAQQGANDRGDVSGMPGNMVVELKNCKAMDLSGWMDEAHKESIAAKVYRYVVIHKRRSKNVRESYVTLPLWMFADMLHSAVDYDSAALRP